MPKLAMMGQQRKMQVQYEEFEINVVFRPAAITTEWQVRLQGLDPKDHGGYLELLAEALVSWDITDDAGVPIPTDAERLVTVPLEILNQVAWDIFEEMSPKARSGGKSAAGSPRTGSLASRQSGT
jgi:hypothetical protein